MDMSKDNPLYERAHFRRIKEVMIELGEYERFNMDDYNLSKIKVYETQGVNMIGSNVRYNSESGRACWVTDNKYEIYEAPHHSNREGSPYGKFIYLAYNKSFDYYIFGSVMVNLDAQSSKRQKRLFEKVNYRNYGRYTIIFQQRENHITKIESGKKFDPGFTPDETSYDFDSYSSRKKSYRTDSHKILKDLGVEDLNSNKISGKKPVKIYDKNKTKKPRY